MRWSLPYRNARPPPLLLPSRSGGDSNQRRAIGASSSTWRGSIAIVHRENASEITVECHGRICLVRNGNPWAKLFPVWSKPLMRWTRERGLWKEVDQSGEGMYVEMLGDAALER